MVFTTISLRDKISEIPKAVEMAFSRPQSEFPTDPGRDAQVLLPVLHPRKLGLSFREGQARLLHDLANIELQAMELGLRTLNEYPEAPQGFREALAAVTLSESKHLEMCVDGIESLGFQWGDWPIHNILWNAVSSEDSLLDRILIVHRYMEGSGLDAGDSLLRKLHGITEGTVHKVIRVIVEEEIGHVDFGSLWYREICGQEKKDPVQDFPDRMLSLKQRLPKRIEKISRSLRSKAGFTEAEIDFLEQWRLTLV